jgi:hypothetical protein
MGGRGLGRSAETELPLVYLRDGAILGPFGRDGKYQPGGRMGGGRTRTRTLDPLIKSQLLYQLSYAP